MSRMTEWMSFLFSNEKYTPGSKKGRSSPAKPRKDLRSSFTIHPGRTWRLIVNPLIRLSSNLSVSFAGRTTSIPRQGSLLWCCLLELKRSSGSSWVLQKAWFMIKSGEWSYLFLLVSSGAAKVDTPYFLFHETKCWNGAFSLWSSLSLTRRSTRWYYMSREWPRRGSRRPSQISAN